MTHILLLTDFSESSKQAFAPAVDFARSLGGHITLVDQTDFVVSAEYLYVEVEIEASNAGLGVSGTDTSNDNGFGVSAGVRSLLADGTVEVSGGMNYTVIDGDGTFGGGAGLRYHFTDMMSAGVGLSVTEDVTAGIVGLRLSFH